MRSLPFREEEEAIKAMGMVRRKGDWKNGKGKNRNNRLFEKREKRPKNERLREAKR